MRTVGRQIIQTTESIYKPSSLFELNLVNEANTNLMTDEKNSSSAVLRIKTIIQLHVFIYRIVASLKRHYWLKLKDCRPT